MARRWAPVFAAGCFAATMLFTPLGFFVWIPLMQIWSSIQNMGELWWDRSYYETLVENVERAGLGASEEATFLISAPDDPAGLERIEPSQFSSLELYDYDRAFRLVRAERKPDGRLIVMIHTDSLGHAGEYGLVYCSGIPDHSDLKYGFGSDGRVRKVGDHWWAVEDHSH